MNVDIVLLTWWIAACVLREIALSIKELSQVGILGFSVHQNLWYEHTIQTRVSGTVVELVYDSQLYGRSLGTLACMVLPYDSIPGLRSEGEAFLSLSMVQ